MKTRLSAVAAVGLMIVLTAPVSAAQPASPKDCLPVLAKDYYSWAETNNLRSDYLKSIDSESWQELKTSNDLDMTAVFSAGIFSLKDDYQTFDSKRTRYLENIHYNRSQQQARNILQITTAQRAYPAYEACLRSLPSGSGLSVWASRESLDEIELRVRYMNPPGVKKMKIEGLVSNGSVEGAPSGHLWKSGKTWGVNQEMVFVVKAQQGAPETNVIVAPADGSSPVSLTFRRADALVELKYVGTTNILHQRDRQASQHTPNNNHNQGHCPNEVGHDSGKWCISRTNVSMSTQAPYHFENARISCRGMGCPWSTTSPATVDPVHVSAFIDNWGWDVDIVLTADEWEVLSSNQCGGDGPIPVIRNQAVLFTSSKNCLPIATLKWTVLPSHSEGTMKFGDKASADGKVVVDSTLDTGAATVVGYKLVK